MASVCLQMNRVCKTLFVFLIIVFINKSYGFRKDVDYNDGQVDLTKHKNIFKLKKYNDIWSRAITNNLSQNKLDNLKRVLNKLDRTELDLKHLHRDDKQLKQQIKEHLNEALKEYGLFDEDVPVLEHKDIHFNDERINQLWQEAIDVEHFSKHELHALHKEMRHMEGKMEEVHTLTKDTENYRRKVGEDMENDVRNSENLVEPVDDKTLDVKKLDEMHSELKDKKALLRERVKYLKEKVRNKSKESEFRDDRVIRLWDSVQKSKFTVDELEDVREELRHFQTHIDKLHHWENYNAKLEKSENKEDVTHTQDKINEYKRKVKKYHVTMVKKMKEYRVEL